MKALGFAVVVTLAASMAACGDNNATPDAAMIHDGSSTPIDAPVTPPATLTSFVIDQIKNHTSSTTDAVPFAMFSALPDPDGTMNNVAAYASLFM